MTPPLNSGKHEKKRRGLNRPRILKYIILPTWSHYPYNKTALVWGSRVATNRDWLLLCVVQHAHARGRVPKCKYLLVLSSKYLQLFRREKRWRSAFKLCTNYVPGGVAFCPSVKRTSCLRGVKQYVRMCRVFVPHTPSRPGCRSLKGARASRI